MIKKYLTKHDELTYLNACNHELPIYFCFSHNWPITTQKYVSWIRKKGNRKTSIDNISFFVGNCYDIVLQLMTYTRDSKPYGITYVRRLQLHVCTYTYMRAIVLALTTFANARNTIFGKRSAVCWIGMYETGIVDIDFPLFGIAN